MPINITAEIGINHNGDLNIAKQLMLAAKAAGCDYVKFQKRVPRLSVPESMWDTPRSTPWGVMKYIEYKERIELGKEDYIEIDRYSKELNIPWFASAWDIPSVEFLEEFNLPFHKVASACLTNDSLIKEMATKQKPIIVSLGMSTEEEIRHAVRLLACCNKNFILCHCNSSYPAPVGELNLRRIERLRQMFPEVPIGYSGHEVGLATTVAVASMGVTYIERHITLDRSMWGTDQSASVEPEGFHRLVKDIRNVEKAMGNGTFCLTEGEQKKRSQLR